LSDSKNSLTVTPCEKYAIKWLLNIPPHLSCVATLRGYWRTKSSSAAEQLKPFYARQHAVLSTH